ncbi:MAG: pseudaminic acid cytidylyltransferase [Alphaproteobacteria bacterium]|nr:pseudaminic acid cytidylyltransferase [Alphaproteobacteria bacterium]
MSSIAIITARGGSKRISRKNIKNFLGKPMIAYAIDAARQSKIFDTVMVSTEDREISEVAKQYGAEVPFMRSEKNASDFATTFDVIDEVISEYKKQNKYFDALCCIYPCVPFLKSDTLKLAYEKMRDFDAVVPVCKYPVPIEWAMNIKGGALTPNNRDAQNIRSQDLEPKYFDVGMFYFCKTEKMYEYNSLVAGKTAAYIIDGMECQDIDTIEDWKLAELKYKMLQDKCHIK